MVQGNETEESSASGLKPGMLLVSRYQIEAPVPGFQAKVFTGVDARSESPILAIEVESVDAETLAHDTFAALGGGRH